MISIVMEVEVVIVTVMVVGMTTPTTTMMEQCFGISNGSVKLQPRPCMRATLSLRQWWYDEYYDGDGNNDEDDAYDDDQDDDHEDATLSNQGIENLFMMCSK